MPQFAALLRKDNKSVRYLVVDDSVFARKNLIKMIETFGGEVAGEAGDGLTAIAEFNRTKPDIVLMDITMPQMEGIEAVERIVRQHGDAHCDGLLCWVPGKHSGGFAKRRQALRAKTRQAGSSVRNSALCAE